MKLKDGFITHDSDGEQIMVAAGDASDTFHGLVRSNKTAAFIIDCLKEETTEARIIDDVLARFETTRDVVTKDVHKMMEVLQKIGALHEE